MPKKRDAREGKDLINAAVQHGLQSLKKSHPELGDRYLQEHIDASGVEAYLSNIQEYVLQKEAKGERWSDKKKEDFIYTEMAKYVASGHILDERGKAFILKKGRTLEEKAKAGNPNELDDIIKAFHDIYAILPQDTAQRNPELAKAVVTIYDAGFMKAAVDVLAQYGLVGENDYNLFTKNIYAKVKGKSQEAARHIGKYTLAEKVAASVLGISGTIIILLSGAGITGNAIGSGGKGPGVISGFLLLVSALLLHFSYQKKIKKKR